jgi:hypothetical protein
LLAVNPNSPNPSQTIMKTPRKRAMIDLLLTIMRIHPESARFVAEQNVCHKLFFEVKQRVIKASSLARVGNCKKLRRNDKNRGLLLGIQSFAGLLTHYWGFVPYRLVCPSGRITQTN